MLKPFLLNIALICHCNAFYKAKLYKTSIIYKISLIQILNLGSTSRVYKINGVKAWFTIKVFSNNERTIE